MPGWSDDVLTQRWELGYEKLVDYLRETGTTNVPQRFLTPDGFKLGGWVATQRTAHIDGVIESKRATRLEELTGWSWDSLETDWQRWFELLGQYVRQYGHAAVPLRYCSPAGDKLGIWVQHNRLDYRKKMLSEERISKLETATGWTWDPLEDKFRLGMEHLAFFVASEGHAMVPLRFKSTDGFALGLWVQNRRRDYATGKLDCDKARQLEELGVWSWLAVRQR